MKEKIHYEVPDFELVKNEIDNLSGRLRVATLTTFKHSLDAMDKSEFDKKSNSFLFFLFGRRKTMDFGLLDTTGGLNNDDLCIIDSPPEGMDKYEYKLLLGEVAKPVFPPDAIDFEVR